jgi:hypothetical protein
MSDMTLPEDHHNQRLVISYQTLRKAVGVLGMLLPVVLAAGAPLFSNCPFIQESISDYYYTNMGNVFVGTLCAVGLFLFSYNGYDRRDMIASKLACIFALGVAFWPTTGPDAGSVCNILQRNSNSWANTIHHISAALFFTTLAYFSLFLFTKSSGHPTSNKKKRNKVYKVCGYIILACILLLFLYFKVPLLQSWWAGYKPVFILETISLWAFGISWLTKGEFILKDKQR